jgi:glycoside/pentoside/hexuronide:cation symporter, GPH family
VYPIPWKKEEGEIMTIWAKSNENQQRISVMDKLCYGAGNLGYGVVFQSLASFLMFYATVILGVPGRYIGMIMSIGVFWDAITDPIMGYISDVTEFKRLGRRHFYILWGTVTISIFNYWLWSISPLYSQGVKISILFANIFFLKVCMTVYGTPYTALGAELSKDYDDRTSIQSYRIFFFLTGLAFPTVAGISIFFSSTAAYPIGQLNPGGYRLMASTTSLMMLVTGFLCYAATKKFIPSLPKAAKGDGQKRNIKIAYTLFVDALRNKHFKYIFWGYLSVNISSALIGALGLHLFTYTFLMKSSEIAVTMGIFFIMTLVSQPFWTSYSAKRDKQPSMRHAILISLFGCCALTIVIFARELVIQNYWLLFPIFCLVGFGAGGLFLFPPSMVGDVIDVEELETGIRSEGIYFGSMTFGYKISQSIALFLVGFSLDLIGFDSIAEKQKAFTAIMIGLILSIGSIAALLAAYYAYRKYSVDKAMVLGIQSKIQNREK